MITTFLFFYSRNYNDVNIRICGRMHSVHIPGHCQVRNRRMKSEINYSQISYCITCKNFFYQIAQYICLWHYKKKTLTLLSH